MVSNVCSTLKKAKKICKPIAEKYLEEIANDPFTDPECVEGVREHFNKYGDIYAVCEIQEMKVD